MWGRLWFRSIFGCLTLHHSCDVDLRVPAEWPEPVEETIETDVVLLQEEQRKQVPEAASPHVQEAQVVFGEDSSHLVCGMTHFMDQGGLHVFCLKDNLVRGQVESSLNIAKGSAVECAENAEAPWLQDPRELGGSQLTVFEVIEGQGADQGCNRFFSQGDLLAVALDRVDPSRVDVFLKFILGFL